MKTDKNFYDKPLHIFLSYIADQKKLFALDMVCAVTVAIIDLVFPYISRLSLNKFLPNNQYSAFFISMLVLLVAYLIKSVLYYVISVQGHKMGIFVEAQMRTDVFNHMQNLSCSYYDKNRTGVLMSHITSDLFEVTELAHHGPEDVLICSLTIIGSLVFMFTIEWRLALVLAIFLPICIFLTMHQRVNMRYVNYELKKKTAEIYSAIESSISGIRTAKAFANEEQENSKFSNMNNLFRTSKEEYYRSMGLFGSLIEFTTGVVPVIVIAIGGFLIMKGNMNYVDLITFTLYVTVFISPVKTLSNFTETYLQGVAGFNRFLEVMRTQPAVFDAPDAIDLNNVEGDIVYDNVSFDYGNGVPILSNINLHINPGQTLAIVGPSGSGKTTLCQLLPRFYDVCEGSVRIDGNDIRTFTQSSLRQNIGLIQQDVFMFAGTIRENIRYGRPTATDAEIIEAAILAKIHDEIMEMPDRYDTYIGERGVMLSGGQKQRISIARVFLKNPKILIFDEATSALDTVTEQQIQHSLDLLSNGRTSIIIAHRLSTVRNADIIAVVDGEHIVETGTHDELINLNGEYAHLCRAQML